MARKVHITRAGRIVIELDGCSDFYGGALVQGALVCRISVPAGNNVDQVIYDLPLCPNAGPDYIDSIRSAVPGIRVYEWGQVR